MFEYFREPLCIKGKYEQMAVLYSVLLFKSFDSDFSLVLSMLNSVNKGCSARNRASGFSWFQSIFREASVLFVGFKNIPSGKPHYFTPLVQCASSIKRISNGHRTISFDWFPTNIYKLFIKNINKTVNITEISYSF